MRGVSRRGRRHCERAKDESQLAFSCCEGAGVPRGHAVAPTQAFLRPCMLLKRQPRLGDGGICLAL